MSKQIYMTKGALMGVFARYAIQQSPYHRPDNLEIVLDKLNELISPAFDKADLGIANFSDHTTLEAYLHRHLATIPEYVAWNDRKNGNDSPMQFTSRYDAPGNPDDDFIDLEALERNVAVDLMRESDSL